MTKRAKVSSIRAIKGIRSRTGCLAFTFPVEPAILPLARHAFFIKGHGHTIPLFRSPCRPLAHLSATNPNTAWRDAIFSHHFVLMFAQPSIPCLRTCFEDVVRASDRKYAHQRQSEGSERQRRINACSCWPCLHERQVIRSTPWSQPRQDSPIWDHSQSRLTSDVESLVYVSTGRRRAGSSLMNNKTRFGGQRSNGR
jgi:hypothetical protein